MGGGDGGPRQQKAFCELPELGEVAGTQTREQACTKTLSDVFRLHNAAMVRLLSIRTGSIEDAKEILQEAYVKVMALDRQGTISLLGGYLWRVAVNLATDRKREWAVRERFRRSALPLVDERESPADGVCEARERLAIVQKAIGELPPKCIEAFVLHVLNGLKFAEVGRIMGISGEMARKYVARSLEYLQTCLDAADAARRGP